MAINIEVPVLVGSITGLRLALLSVDIPVVEDLLDTLRLHGTGWPVLGTIAVRPRD